MPLIAQGAAAPADALAELVVDAVRHQELRILGPAVKALGEAHFLHAERIAVRGCGVLLVRRAVADDAVDDDQRRLVFGAAECFYRFGERRPIIGVAHAHHVPAIAFEPALHVFAEGELGVAFDGHRVAVVNPAQIGEAEMAGKRRRLARHAFHQIAVAADRVNVEVEQCKARPVVARGEPARRDRHANAVAGTLTERPGCGLDAGGVAVFRVPGRDAVELAEILDVVEAHRWSRR